MRVSHCSLVNDIDTARLLLKEGCNFDDSASGSTGPTGPLRGPTPLHVAALNERGFEDSLEFVKFLVEEAKVDINARAETETWDGVTATDMALDLAENCPTAEAGYRGVFDYLRSRGGVTTLNS